MVIKIQSVFLKWPSMQRWQCPIHKGANKNLYLINNVAEIVIFLGLKIKIKNNSFMFSCSRNATLISNSYLIGQSCLGIGHCHISRATSRGLNGSVNISESCDFWSQFDPFYLIFLAFFLKSFFCQNIQFEWKSIEETNP